MERLPAPKANRKGKRAFVFVSLVPFFFGGGELSRLSTSMAIGAVVVEVQTEEELAVQAACGWEIRDAICSAEKKTNRKNEESSPVEGSAGAHFSFSFFSNSSSVPRTNHFSDFPSTSCLNGELLLGLYLDRDRADCLRGA